MCWPCTPNNHGGAWGAQTPRTEPAGVRSFCRPLWCNICSGAPGQNGRGWAREVSDVEAGHHFASHMARVKQELSHGSTSENVAVPERHNRSGYSITSGNFTVWNLVLGIYVCPGVLKAQDPSWFLCAVAVVAFQVTASWCSSCQTHFPSCRCCSCWTARQQSSISISISASARAAAASAVLATLLMVLTPPMTWSCRKSGPQGASSGASCD